MTKQMNKERKVHSYEKERRSCPPKRETEKKPKLERKLKIIEQMNKDRKSSLL